jgi:Holliday junction DNA helicase RuvA
VHCALRTRRMANLLYLLLIHSMIAFLNGVFAYKSPAMVQMDVNGVGYEVQISLNTFSAIQNLDKGTLFTHLQIREDGHTLYGFADLAEKNTFVHLISVNGVGASTARMMLSSMKPVEISRAIVQGNSGLLEKIKGIGKKSAERIILELRDKFAKQGPELNSSPLINNTLEQDALNALVALGIARNAAENAIKKALSSGPSNENLESIIKKALQSI